MRSAKQARYLLPGLRPRPSLRGRYRRLLDAAITALLPGLRPRPSLRVQPVGRRGSLGPPVAGVTAPAFIEGRDPRPGMQPHLPVAGVTAPAFIEGPSRYGPPYRSPSSVAGVTAPAFIEGAQWEGQLESTVRGCCRGYGPGLH